MEGASRTRLVALAVLLALSVPLVVIALAGGGSDERDGLRVEQSQGVSEVVIYLEDPAVNRPETNNGRTRVGIVCVDSGGRVVFRGEEAWPFSDTDGGKFDPHAHVAVEPERLSAMSRCRLTDTNPPLEGRKV